jgi:hypothetical protein
MTSLDSISEVPASGATQLRTAAQAAILAAAGGRLKRVARGWIGNGIAAPIRDTIINGPKAARPAHRRHRSRHRAHRHRQMVRAHAGAAPRLDPAAER